MPFVDDGSGTCLTTKDKFAKAGNTFRGQQGGDRWSQERPVALVTVDGACEVIQTLIF